MSTAPNPRIPTGVSLGLLVLRVVTGAVFFAHGFQKVSEFTIAGTTASFADMGVPLPEVVAPVVAVLELVGGALLVFGVLTRVMGALLAVDMIGAIILVHAPAGLWVDAGGYEFVALLAAAAAALVLAGPGAVAVSRLLPRRAQPLLG